MTVVLPDISFYQDSNTTARGVDFARMKTQTNAVIIRAGQRSWVDEDFASNWRAAKAAQLWRGAYWFYDSRHAPILQADIFVNAIGADYPECGVWMDFEESYGGAWGREVDFINFADRVKERLPSHVEAGVYTRKSWWDFRASANPFWKQFLLWVAHYGVVQPAVPAPWTGWTFHQYTSSGNGASYGVESSRIDLNYYNGDWHQFAALFGLATLPQPPAPVAHVLKLTLDGKVLYEGEI